MVVPALRLEFAVFISKQLMAKGAEVTNPTQICGLFLMEVRFVLALLLFYNQDFFKLILNPNMT